MSYTEPLVTISLKEYTDLKNTSSNKSTGDFKKALEETMYHLSGLASGNLTGMSTTYDRRIIVDPVLAILERNSLGTTYSEGKLQINAKV